MPSLEEMQKKIAERRASPDYVDTDPRVVARAEARMLVSKARQIESASGDPEWVTAYATLALAILALDGRA